MYHQDICTTPTWMVGKGQSLLLPHSNLWLVSLRACSQRQRGLDLCLPTYQDTKTSSVANRDARKDFFHFVPPLSAHVECKDLLFFTNDVKTATTPVLATYGLWICLHRAGQQISPREIFSRCFGSIQRLHGINTLCQGDSSSLQTCTVRGHRLSKRQRYHGGSGFSCDVPNINHFGDTPALLGQSSTPTVKVTRGLTPISLGFHVATKCTRIPAYRLFWRSLQRCKRIVDKLQGLQTSGPCRPNPRLCLSCTPYLVPANQQDRQ